MQGGTVPSDGLLERDTRRGVSIMRTWILAIVLMMPATAIGAPRNTAPVAIGVGRPTPGRSPAQARLMARRAAELVAVRDLARQHTSAPSVRVQGFYYVRYREFRDGRVEVVVRARPWFTCGGR